MKSASDTATAINASLYPIVSEYVTRLAEVLRGAGYRKELLIANCVGGMMPPDEIIRRPIYSVMSGPTLAPIAAGTAKPMVPAPPELIHVRGFS